MEPCSGQFEEATAALNDAVNAVTDATEKSEMWRMLAETLPFDPNDPLAFTPEQRKRILVDTSVEWADKENGLPFADMLADQQAFIRKQAESSFLHTPVVDPDRPDRAVQEADLQGAHLRAVLDVVLTLDVPGAGLMTLDPDLDVEMELSYGNVSMMLTPSDKNDEWSTLPEEWAHPKPVVANADVRALAVPVLDSARLAELAKEMRRSGFNMLLYPAMFGGYATFPNSAFLLHPALRGANGWAAAVKAMKPMGIKLVAYVPVLAWQSAGDNNHWLLQHKDWLDVDILGRTRLEWAERHPEPLEGLNGATVPMSNYVRPSEPAVAVKLNTLLDELAAKPDVAGIAFGEWMPLTAANGSSVGRMGRWVKNTGPVSA